LMALLQLDIMLPSEAILSFQVGLLAHVSFSSFLPGINQWITDSSSYTVAGAAADFHRFPY